jgi:FtsP/CotA-like multicopper oxidase with cupredoxin domain
MEKNGLLIALNIFSNSSIFHLNQPSGTTGMMTTFPNPPHKMTTNVLAGLALLLALAGGVIESKTVEYTWTLRPGRASPAVANATTRAELNNPAFSPDCNLDRLMLLANDALPGPTLYADVGDTVKLTMINESPIDSLALHFHGLHMQGQPYADGVPSVTQCAVGPLETQVHEFTITNPGTHYWHGRE